MASQLAGCGAPVELELHDLGQSEQSVIGGEVDRETSGVVVLCAGGGCDSSGSIRDSEWASRNAPVCSGDSGGPALDSAGRVFGVASRGDLDCEVAVYGDVSSWSSFIADTAIEAASLGRYDAPEWAKRVSSRAQVDPDASSSASSACSTGGVGGAPARVGPGLLLGCALLLGARRPRRGADA